jgi:hypothetical protein
MKRLIVVSVIMAVMLLTWGSVAPAHAQDSAKDDKPTFYHLVPGTYVNGWPRFTVHYPKEWTERYPAPTEAFRVGVSLERGGEMLWLNIFGTPVPLNQAAGPYVLFFKQNMDPNATVVSDRPSQLRDRTPARDFEMQMVVNNGTLPFTTITLATKKADVLVQLSVGWPGRERRDDLKAILYSLEFQPGFDEPVKVPPDVQAFLDKHRNDNLAHDIEQLMTNYSDKYLNSGVRKAEWGRYVRQMMGNWTSFEISITDFVSAGDKAYLAGIVSGNFGKDWLRETAIIKENGQWRWYGNQRDATPW